MIPTRGSKTAPLAKDKPRVLCVDDEPQVLEGLTLNLRRRFEVVTAPGGQEALAIIQGGAPFPVVISDMRMPQMNGATFLARVHQDWPDTVRLLLTGHADIESAIAAVNEGQIFRFLAKPCPPDKLIAAVDAAVEQYRLITSERVLLEQTLHGSIKTLTDILALQNPIAFGRASRAKTHVAAMAEQLVIKERWPIEVAAMLSPVGSITLPPDIVEKVHAGTPLSLPEHEMVKRAPAILEQLLANIPRLEPVREILGTLEARFDGEGGRHKGSELPIGSRLLKIAIDYDILETRGLSRSDAIDTMRGRRGLYDTELLSLFAHHLGSQEKQAVVEEVSVSRLRPEMVFMEDVRTMGGALLIARGHEVTGSLIERIRNFSRNGGVKEPLRVLVPSHLLRRGD